MRRTHSVSVRQSRLEPARRWPVSFLRSIVRASLDAACPDSAEVSLTLTNDAEMQTLNSRYRGIDGPTDVLAFALEEGPSFELPEGVPRQLGDVVVSLDTTTRNSEASGNSLSSELAWVICHGTLHLLGYDHQSDEQLYSMRDREREILATLGIERNWPELWPEENKQD